MQFVFRKLLVFIVILASFSYAQSQVRNTKKNSTASKKTAFTLLTEKPGVYIDFERAGKRPPPGDDVSDEAVWLKLHNNMRFSIKFCAFSLIDEKGNLLTYEEAGEIGLNYEVELTNPSNFVGTQSDVPTGNKSTGLCHVFTLEAGKSIVFSVPAEHLIKGLSIKVPFNYEWEKESEDNPTHFVYFNSARIPKK
jgi:hypothetical protein